jgi:hypothetical protein
MLRRTTFLALCLILLPTGVIVADDKKNDIRCEAKGNYIGNVISPVFSLSIAGPREKTWVYRYSDNMSGLLKEPPVNEFKGTYELADGLAIFTGTGTFGRGAPAQAQEVRFGVNYGFVGGEVYFDRLFATDGGTLRYKRRWYEKRGEEWQLVEERTLALPPKGLEEGAKSWEVTVTGERVRWDKEGKKTVERAEEKIVYKKHEDTPGYYFTEQSPATKWLPAELYPTFVKGKPEVVGIKAPSIGELRGLAPLLALRPEDR